MTHTRSVEFRADVKWPLVPLVDVATIERSAVKPDQIQGDELYVGLENVTGEGGFEYVATAAETGLKSNKFAFTQDHVLYGKLRPYLVKIAAPGFGGICSTDILPIRPSSKLDKRYLLQYLRTPEMVAHAAKNTVGINLPRLSPKVLESFGIPLPPIEEQRRIAAVLDAADALRAKRRQALAKLGTLTQAIFHGEFGDPAVESAWPRVQLAEVCLYKGEYGANVPAVEFDRRKPRYLRITDIQSDGTLTNDAVAPGGTEGQWRPKLLRPGDLLFARSGATVGKTFLVRDEDPPLVFAGYLIRFVPDQRWILPEFLYQCTRTEKYRNWVSAVATTVAQPNVNASKYGQFELSLPPMELQRQFVDAAKRIRQRRASLEASSFVLDSLFASLQQRAFRGEL